MLQARLGIRESIGATGVVAVTMVVLPLLPADAESRVQPVASGYLKSLFDRHDACCALLANDSDAKRCMHNEAERGQ